MKISTPINLTAKRFGDFEAVRLIAEAGFDAIDFSAFEYTGLDHPINKPEYLEYAARLKKTAEEHGVYFNQTHAPFPSYKENDAEYNTKTFEDIRRSIAFTGALGAEYIIVHPFALSDKSVQLERNLDFFNSLLPACKKAKVKIAVENMYGYNNEAKAFLCNVCSTAEELALYVDKLDNDWFTVCLDVGHSGLIGQSAADAVRILGHQRLKTVHIHDNDGTKDMHMLPFCRGIDWSELVQAFADIRYDGDFTLEAESFLRDFPPEMTFDTLKFMAATARYLADEITKRKK